MTILTFFKAVDNYQEVASNANALNESLENMNGTFGKHASAAGDAADAIGKVTTATGEQTVAQRELFAWVNRGGEGWSAYATVLGEVWTALRAITWADTINFVRTLGSEAGITVAALGLFQSAAMVVGTAVASWQIGRTIGDWTGLTVGIQHATERLFGWGTANEALLSHQDALNLAIARGGKNLTNYSDVIAFNTQWLKNQQEGFKELVDLQTRRDGPITTTALLAQRTSELTAEYQKLADAGVLVQFQKDAKNAALSTDDLSKAYRVSTVAVTSYRAELKQLADADKKAEEARKKYQAALEKEAAAELRAAETLLKARLANIASSEHEGTAAARAIAQQLKGQDVLRTLSIQMGDTQLASRNLADKGLAYVGDISEFTAAKVRALKTPLFDLGTALQKSLESFPAILDRAFTGGGGVAGALHAIATRIGSDFANAINAAVKQTIANADLGVRGGVVSGKTVGAAGAIGAIAGVGTAASGGGFGASAGAAGMAGVAVGAGVIGAGGTAAIGSAIALGAATAGIGLAAVGAYFALKKLFAGPSKQELAGRDLVKQFEDANGGLAGMQKALMESGLSADEANAHISAMWAAEKQGGAAVQAQIDGMNALIQKHAADVSTGVDDILAAATNLGGQFPAALEPMVQRLASLPGITDDEKSALLGLLGAGKPSLEELTTAAAKYGMTLDDMGKQVQQMSISKTADEILTDFKNLTGAGADYGNTINHFAGSVSTLVQNALKYGTTLPTGLKPIVDALSNAGELTDVAGDKIGDLSKLKFDDANDPLAQSLNNLTKALDHLGDLLSGLPGKARDAAAGIPDNPFAGWVPPSPHENNDPEHAQAAGGFGYATGPMKFSTRGKEWYWFGGEGNPMPAGGNNGASGDLVIVADGRELARVVNFRQDRTLRGRKKLAAA